MADKRLMDILNQSIARELAATVQYMYQHVMASGLESAEVEEVFRKTSMDEMKHIERFAERLDYFGGIPTTKPTPIKVGGTVVQMLQDNIQAEEEAIALYKDAIKLSQELGDPVTRLLYEEVLSQEEGHHYTFTTLLGNKGGGKRGAKV